MRFKMDKKYIGSELELFKHVHNWKKYFGKLIKPYLTGRVLEVGAGIGSTTQIICDGNQEKWICLEPDVNLSKQIKTKILKNQLPKCCVVINGTINDIKNDIFDAILYIDVLEHIENDCYEIESASKHLAENGVLIVMVPAYQWLYSPFDKAIGHLRRYNKNRLKNIAPSCLRLCKIMYLDSVGVLLSSANKILLKQSCPKISQLHFWDNFIIPLSKIFDPLNKYSIGKSLLAIWRKNSS